MAATKAPSTTSENPLEETNPLEESYAKITGTTPLSADAGTSLVNYADQSGFRSPAADVINISGDPGTGATTAETWSHDIALENQKQAQLEFEYEQAQAEIANELKAEEAARAAESLGLSKAASAREAAAQAASEGRAAALAPYQLASTKAAARVAALDAAAKERQAQDEARARGIYAGIQEQFRWQGNYPITPESSAAYMAARTPAPQSTWGTFEYNTRGATPVYKPGVTTYQPKQGTSDYYNYRPRESGVNSLTGRSIYG